MKTRPQRDGARAVMSLDKAKGVIYGLAIGDALGAPSEFLRLDQIKAKYGEGGIGDLPNPALYTDDTQMSIAIAEALIEAGEKDVDVIMEAVREEFIRWYHSPDNTRAPGGTCLKGVANLEKRIHWTKSGVARSKGCGCAMRVAPVGYLYQHDTQKLREVAHATGICTHGHPAADSACIGAAYLVKPALDGVRPESMLQNLFSFTAEISPDFDKTILKVAKCLHCDEEEAALSDIGEGWVGEEAVALTLYCFLRHPESYERCVIRGANTNGNSDSIACIAGSISGAYLGVGAIPEKWVRRVEKSDHLADVARRLAAKKMEIEDARQQGHD